MQRLKNALLDRKDIVSGRLIANILEKADPDGLVHGIAVAEIAAIIGEAGGLNEAELSELWLAGLLHDIGKLGVPSEVLNSPAPTAADLKYMRKHVTIGRYLATQLFGGAALGRSIEAHHERYDGTGYPHGLKGDEIPWDARAIGIADYYDSARSAGWILNHRSHGAVMDEIRAKSGAVFDPALVDAATLVSSAIADAHKDIHATTPRELSKWL